jgi:hypothetical protein
MRCKYKTRNNSYSKEPYSFPYRVWTKTKMSKKKTLEQIKSLSRMDKEKNDFFVVNSENSWSNVYWSIHHKFWLSIKIYKNRIYNKDFK